MGVGSGSYTTADAAALQKLGDIDPQRLEPTLPALRLDSSEFFPV